MRHLAWLLIVAVAGCAPKRPAAPAPAPVAIDLAPADALLKAGCYRCLLQAHEIYERGRTSSLPSERARAGSLTTAIFLALREKELDLDATPWLERARAIATPSEAVYVDVVSRLPWNGGGAPDFEPTLPLTQEVLEDWRANGIAAARNPVLDSYLLITLECRMGTRQSRDRAIESADLDAPLLKYRAGLCDTERRPLLDALVAEDARFAEAWYFIGRYEMASAVNPGGGRGNRRWLVTAVKPLTQAHEAFPDAPTITAVFGGLMRARNDLRRALALYDDALMRRPTHGDALLGRTVALSYLKRYDEAIAAADRIITLARGHVGSAFYYRAWNEYQKEQLEGAASDVATAKRMRAPEEALVLSGMVAYDQKRFRDARFDFDAAVAENPARCAAHWYLGLLNLDEEAWSQAVRTFSEAASCYEMASTAIRREVDQLPEDLPPDVRAEQLASLDETFTDSKRQAGRSFYNAAQAAVRLGDNTSALGFARTATSYDDVRDRAEAIVKRLEK